MTRLGLRNFLCVLPDEPMDHGHRDWTEDGLEQLGTSHNNKDLDSMTDIGNVNASAVGGVNEATRRRDRVNCSSGGAYFLACFRAGAINLIVHPAMAAMGAQKQVATSEQSLSTLPRTSFLSGIADVDSSNDPTSPIVTCIGQVKKNTSNTPLVMSSQVAMRIANVVPHLRSLKSMRERPEKVVDSSPMLLKWRQILGARGTAILRTRNRRNVGCQVDLNRFSSARSAISRPTVLSPSEQT